MIEGVGHFETEAIQAREFLRRKNRRRFAHPITPTSGVLGTPFARIAQILRCATTACSG
jgi:hypothetical protein